jgi:WD40-like Beta Propeller Repeat
MLIPIVAAALAFSAPQKISALDKIKGEPTQIAWSPDGAEIYVQTGERTKIGTFDSPHYYVLTVADQKIKTVDAPPAWAAEYFTWKAGKSAPGASAFAIDISEDKRQQRAVSAPMGGDLAKGGGAGAGTSSDDVVTSALTTQLQHVITLKLKGEVVGEYVDLQFVPGYTFGWAPQSLGTYIAYQNKDGRLGVMDQQGTKSVVADTKNVLLPAWTNDGKKIAFVQKNGKKFDLFVTDVR